MEFATLIWFSLETVREFNVNVERSITSVLLTTHLIHRRIRILSNIYDRAF